MARQTNKVVLVIVIQGFKIKFHHKENKNIISFKLSTLNFNHVLNKIKKLIKYQLNFQKDLFDMCVNLRCRPAHLFNVMDITLISL